MCTDMLKNISDSVTRTILQSSSTSGTFNLTSPMSSEHMMKLFNCNIQSCVESSLSQAVCQVIGEDIPARISPELTQATVTEVLGEVNSVLTTQASSSTAAPASSRVSKDRAGEKCLAGAITTMKSFLTGRGTLVMRRIKKRQSLEPNNKEEKAARGQSTRRKDSLLKRCLIARLMSKIQPAPVGDVTEPQSDQNSKADLRVTPVELEDNMEDGDKSPDSSLSAIDSVPPELHEDMSNSSQCQSKDSKRRNGFCRFFCKILPKDQKNKRKETDKNEAKEARSKQVPLWIRRLFGSCSSNK
ncbi:uncharacterized protein LOC130163690 [Seriola aureovittata]|uniref:uncharacterized protein LOC130163690 n=1 Tax=Seriola aureovittata TaxID=2871759 RepID=UPI0024BE0097|nr:uncharacterized protein LOC130163690 [Seriola aureovittata]